MMYSKIFLLVCFFHLYKKVASSSSLTFVLSPGNEECLYLPKSSGDQITASFQVVHGDHVSFKMLDPRKNLIYERRDSDGYDLDQRIHISGDYGFCFQHVGGRESTGVNFEWDYHLGSQEDATFKKKLEDEKRRYLMNKINENKPKVAVGSKDPNVQPVVMHDGSQKEQLFDEMSMDTVAHATIMLSFNLDRILHYMSLHKSKMALSHNLQIRNATTINYYSVGICSLIVIMGLVQVIVVKSFFSGKLSIKVWEF